MEHSVVMEARSRVRMTGIFAIDCFDEKKIVVSLEDGRLAILGKGLVVSKFNTEDKTLAVEGEVDALQYLSKQQNVLKKLFR